MNQVGRNLRPRRRGFTLVELLVSLAIISLLLALTMPAVQQSRAAARRAACTSNLRQLCLALHNYHDSHQILPPGSFVRGPSFPTESGWGWGSMILPHVDQGPLWNQIHFGLPTANGANRPAVAQSVRLWVCPADSAPDQISVALPGYPDVNVATGNYCGVSGVLAGMSAIRFANIIDGLSQTIFLSERVNQPGTAFGSAFTSAWCGYIAERDVYVFNATPFLDVNPSHPINLSMNDPKAFTSRHTGGAYFAMGDGTVRFVSENIDIVVLDALSTPDGGELIPN